MIFHLPLVPATPDHPRSPGTQYEKTKCKRSTEAIRIKEEIYFKALKRTDQCTYCRRTLTNTT